MQRVRRRLHDILSPGGLLSKVVGGYESRPQQLALGEEVLDTLLGERILLAEAPTGVGKTMAYLVPAALFARQEHQPVIISSYTRALQDQVLEQEAPRLQRLIHPDLQVVALKGRTNYLCRRRWDLFIDEAPSGPDGRWVRDRLEGWVNTTQTGAFSEAPDLGRRARWALARIGGDAHFCRSRLCRADGGCFHKQARRTAREADLLVVNHSLLLADALGGGVLPDYGVVIIDEAHLLPVAALDPLSRRIAERAFEDRLRQMGGTGDPGVSDRLRRVVRRLPSKVDAQRLGIRLRDFEDLSRAALAQCRAFFAGLRGSRQFPAEGERRRYGMADVDGELLPANTDAFLDAVTRLLELGERLPAEIEDRLPGDESFGDLRGALEAGAAHLEEMTGQFGTLSELLAPADHGQVYVLEASRRQGAVLSAVPLDTGPALREHLLEARSAVAMTSATLRAGESGFGFFARQVGLQKDEADTLALPTPFDMPRQLLILAAAYGVDPREPGYEAFLADAIAAVQSAVGRKMLVLFTAYKTLQAVAARLDERPELKTAELLVQSQGAPRRQIIEGFKRARQAVLLGAASFWQGVDFPGDELELLVVTRLPFPVPTDPRTAAIGEELEAEGRSSFQEYALPEAVLRLRQGVGRLIRRSDDRGACLILDPRLLRARYGQAFCAALPAPLEAAGSQAEMIARVKAWFPNRRP